MKTPKKNRAEVRSNTLSILLTDEQKEAVEAEANKMGLSMSAWARMILAEKINQKERER
jgi:antitoxin component of RelBE/YafQ-DinJ toxin-antitoxin module